MADSFEMVSAADGGGSGKVGWGRMVAHGILKVFGGYVKEW